MPRDPVSDGPVRLGFFGKIPARGDFVRGNLSRAFTEAVHAWADAVLPALEARFGPDWPELWARASPWRFASPPGLIGPACSSGVVVPSRDRVGRPFPLVVAVEHGSLDENALANAENAARDAAQGRFQPEDLERALAALPPTPCCGASAGPDALLRPTDAGRMATGGGLPVDADALAWLVP